MDRIGADGILAVAVVVWFVVTGLADLLHRSTRPDGRTDPAWLRVTGRLRGVLEVLGAAAVAAGTAVAVLGVRVAFPGRAVGLALAVLSLWGAAEAARPPIRWLRLVLVVIGFALAVFYAGFRD